MTELKVHDAVFPFVCETPGCGKEYDLEGFRNVAILWDYIHLTNDEYNLIGITCPECSHTTIKKFPVGLFVDIQPVSGFFESEVDFNNFIPFSPKILEDLSLVKFREPPKDNNQNLYKLPSICHPIREYPLFITKTFPYAVSEEEIGLLMDIENNQRFKAFPRIAYPNSIYRSLDECLVDINQTGKLPDYLLDRINEALRGVINDSHARENVVLLKSSESLKGLESLVNKIKIHYADMIKNDPTYELTKDEEDLLKTEKLKIHYVDLIKNGLDYDEYEMLSHNEDFAWNSDVFQKNIGKFIEDYKIERNRLDFNLIYNDELVNKHALKLYGNPNFVMISDMMIDPPSQKKTADQSTEDQKQKLQEYEYLLNEVSKIEEEFPLFKEIIALNPQMLKLKRDMAKKLAIPDVDILILGESGTGKELFPKALHQVSKRKNAKFVAFSIAATSKDILESELFGQEKGAFTDAPKRAGLFRNAEGGIIFLDEISEIPLGVQVKLLRVFENREVKPLGAEDPIFVDIRFIFATNRNLKQEVTQGNLREDFYYRINNHPQIIPPLRERQDDIPLLADHFRVHYNEEFEKQIESFTPEFIKGIRNHPWKGNVREFKSVMEHAMINCEGNEIGVANLPASFLTEETEIDDRPKKEGPPAEKFLDHELIFWMKKLDGNKSLVAKKLGVDRVSIHRRIKKLKKLTK